VDPYVQQLADAIEPALPIWMTRCVVDTAVRLTGTCSPELRREAAEMAVTASPRVLAELIDVLATDVDEQRTNPLSVLRAAVRHPSAVLAAHHVPAVSRDEFAARAFPADVYGLSPATWADIDPDLAEPGLIWGAWKAKTVLDRRRAEGRPPDRPPSGLTADNGADGGADSGTDEALDV
jgi:hypothetical protein